MERLERTGAAISLRLAEPEDAEFLFTLYASTRMEEFSVVGWEKAQIEALLSMQFEAQRQSYALQFPAATNQIILLGGLSIGRILLDGVSVAEASISLPADALSAIHLIDIAILPAYRRQGIGAQLLRDLQSTAASVGRPVTLNVLVTNPALRLYQRLGFTINGQDELYYQLIWEPDKK